VLLIIVAQAQRHIKTHDLLNPIEKYFSSVEVPIVVAHCQL